MKIERDERRFDFHDIGLAIKRAREAAGMTQEQLAYIVDRAPRTIMYNENDGQHPSLNTFYQMVTMFDISVLHIPSFHFFHHCQKSGTVKASTTNAIVREMDNVCKALPCGELLQHCFLRRDLSRVFFPYCKDK